LLAQDFTIVAMDMRGYGKSSAPASDDSHTQYSKRTMARDAVAVMKQLGHTQFHVMGHDRGARVAYRLALDTPEAVNRLVLLDIVPTIEQWDAMDANKALSGYHWMFLAQGYPMPENLIGSHGTFYADWTLSGWTKDKTLAAFDPNALEEYRGLFADRQRIHALCEDYRAGASFDRKVDEQDRADGRKISGPSLVLWGTDYLGLGKLNPLEVWQNWCLSVEGQAIDSGHFLAEENPSDTAAAVLSFLKSG
ncbi:MAG: alpha/beta hydrolase, partial [Pseudomonadota bacterium]